MHCDECFEADEFFLQHSAQSLSVVDAYPETLPLAFLNDSGFRHLLPGLVGLLARDCGAADLLILIENRLDILTEDEAAALRDVLYALYDIRSSEFEGGFFAYETLRRVLDHLDQRAG